MSFIEFEDTDDRERNIRTKRRKANQESCIRCGKPVTIGKKTSFIWLVDGGWMLAPVGYEMTKEERGGDVGLHPIGTACRKKFPKNYIHPVPDYISEDL